MRIYEQIRKGGKIWDEEEEKEKEELIDEEDGDHEGMQYTRWNKYKSKLGKEEK